MRLVIFLLLLFCLNPRSALAQRDSVKTTVQDTSDFICVFPEMPQFPGGDTAFVGYLRRNIVYPESAKKARKEGTVYIYFEVGKDGTVGNVMVKKGVKGAPELDAEAVRVIKAMPPWTPGYIDGKAAKVSMTVPIQFILGS